MIGQREAKEFLYILHYCTAFILLRITQWVPASSYPRLWENGDLTALDAEILVLPSTKYFRAVATIDGSAEFVGDWKEQNMSNGQGRPTPKSFKRAC